MLLHLIPFYHSRVFVGFNVFSDGECIFDDSMFCLTVWRESHYAYYKFKATQSGKKISFSIIPLMPTLKLIILSDIKIVRTL